MYILKKMTLWVLGSLAVAILAFCAGTFYQEFNLPPKIQECQLQTKKVVADLRSSRIMEDDLHWVNTIHDNMHECGLSPSQIGTTPEELDEMRNSICRAEITKRLKEIRDLSFRTLFSPLQDLGYLQRDMERCNISFADLEVSNDEIDRLYARAHAFGLLSRMRSFDSRNSYSSEDNPRKAIHRLRFFLQKYNISLEEINTTEEELSELIQTSATTP